MAAKLREEPGQHVVEVEAFAAPARGDRAVVDPGVTDRIRSAPGGGARGRDRRGIGSGGGEPALRVPTELVAVVVDQAVVERAEQREVVQVGRAAAAPPANVMSLQVAGLWAAREHALVPIAHAKGA